MSTDLPEIPESEVEDEVFSDEDGVLYDDEVTPEYGILGFTLRELLIVGVWLLHFAVSFFPVAGSHSLWALGIQWLLPIGLPTAATFLIVLRRFSPDGIRRVGSLGIDQFASVAYSVAACVTVGNLWLAVLGSISVGGWAVAWSVIALVITSLALVVLTVFAPLVPGLKEDFQGRLVTLAHRNANPVRPVIARPRPVVEATDAAQRPAASTSDGWVDAAAPAVAGDAPQPGPVTMVLDLELSRQQATDEIARLDLAPQVSLGGHASGGDTGTADATADDQYTPYYSRRSRSQDPEETDSPAQLPDDRFSRPQSAGEQLPQAGEPVAVAEPAAAAVDAEQSATAEPATDAEQSATAEPATDAEQSAAAEPAATAESETARLSTDVHEVLGDLLGDAEADAHEDDTDIDATKPRDAQQASASPTASAPQPTAQQPFWILAPTERDVHDERGETIYRIGPTAWALVIEDRGGAYVVRHDDGRIGYLHDISDVTKG